MRKRPAVSGKEVGGAKQTFYGDYCIMLTGILEGLIKPEVNVKTNMDMSNKSGDTYNINEIKIGNLIGTLVITDAEAAREITSTLLQLQQRSTTEVQSDHPE